jgi:ornithine decarboxylase
MKSMKIAVSRELVSTVSTHREKVTLDNTDFTDVAAVVITVAESCSGILALLNVPAFSYRCLCSRKSQRMFLKA